MDADGHSPKPQKGFSSKFAKWFGSKRENVTEQEILMMVDAGEEEGVIEQSQKAMINNIFEFDDMAAEDVMTHRVDIVAIPEDAKISDVVYHAINDGFSRIPVYKEDIDNIIGIIYVKDLLCLVGCKTMEEYSIQQFIREVLYVPETTRCRDLFKQFTEKKLHIAVVVDEYGGTAGIVTMEDLIESIVGNIQDEYDDEEEEITKINDTTYTMEGTADWDDVAQLLGIEAEENPDYDTVGGFLIDQLGRIPREGEHPVVRTGGVEFTVLVVEERHIAKVRAVKNPKAAETE